MRGQPLRWTRVSRGWYEATAPDGSWWRIVRAASYRWEVISRGDVVFSWPATLAEAKLAAEEEADPVARQRRDELAEVRRRALRARDERR